MKNTIINFKDMTTENPFMKDRIQKGCYVVWHPVGGPVRVYNNEHTAKLNCDSDSIVVKMTEAK